MIRCAQASSPPSPPRPLAREFFMAPTEVVASRLLGHFLLRRVDGAWLGGPVVETEAYLEEDPACHAFRGETARNRSMFGPPGHAYVYLVYGIHHCVNAVCQPAGRGEAVLIRAIEPWFGKERLRVNRRVSQDARLVDGPGKICAALAIDRGLDGIDLCDPGSQLMFAQNPGRARWLGSEEAIRRTPRIGITRAADLPLRFVVGNPD
ncbi:MAG: DNA-3-methyladenine glycosylase [Verrucomicrobia bacterium]|nr:DNA-3-methyladenine glycosylase [Verrucomicrobiota bacterium]MBI3867941.1 DNA-3-methyladenine glycosylase [Verrucomicrobiota bacterium]